MQSLLGRCRSLQLSNIAKICREARLQIATTTHLLKDETVVNQGVSSVGMPEVVMNIDEDSKQHLTEDEIRARKSESVKSWLETTLGKEKIEIVKLLQEHNVVVRGGPQEGQKFIKALLDWKQRQ